MQIIRQIRIHNERSNFCSLDPTDIQLLSSSSVSMWHFCHHLTMDPHSLWAAQDGGKTMESCVCGALTPSFLTAPPAPNLTPIMIHSLHSSLHYLFREWIKSLHHLHKNPPYHLTKLTLAIFIYIYIYKFIYIGVRPILVSKPMLWLVLLSRKFFPLLKAVIPCSSFRPHWNCNSNSSSLTQTEHMPHTHLKLAL